MVIFAIAGLLAMAGIGAAYYVRKRKKETEADEMPAGLQVFDENGNVIGDTSYRAGKVLGRKTLVGAGTISVTEGNIWFCMIGRPEATGVIREHGDKTDPVPVVKIENNAIVWTSIPTNSLVDIVYGVY